LGVGEGKWVKRTAQDANSADRRNRLRIEKTKSGWSSKIQSLYRFVQGEEPLEVVDYLFHTQGFLCAGALAGA